MSRPLIKCIQSRNPGAGFLLSHRRFCSRCDEDATHHRLHGSHYCENLCEHCATETKDRKRVLKSGVEPRVFVVGDLVGGSGESNSPKS